MTVLCDRDIREELENGELEVSPVNLTKQLQPNSLDIRLGHEYSILLDNGDVMDLEDGVDDDAFVDYYSDDFYCIDDGDFILANTIENFNLPDNIYGQIHGRSSLGRVGVNVHSTAGLIDAGYQGNITLELSSDARRGVKLYPGMRIGQVVFHHLSDSAEKPYSEEENKYQNQEGVTYSRIDQEL